MRKIVVVIVASTMLTGCGQSAWDEYLDEFSSADAKTVKVVTENYCAAERSGKKENIESAILGANILGVSPRLLAEAANVRCPEDVGN